MTCPKCGSTNVTTQTFQENAGSTTVTTTKSKYKEKGHGCLWWLLIGWWWWIIDLLLWITMFLPRFCIKLFRKKKYVGDSASVSNTTTKINYKTVCVCADCGHRWDLES